MKRLRDSADVIEQILMYLPIRDAARTSILSKDWRYRWRSIPQLVFDANFAATFHNDHLLDKKKVMLSIYRALIAHDGPITKFKLDIPGLNPSPQIDLLMPYLTSKQVQELTLLVDTDDDYAKLRAPLFSAINLRRLKLQRCEFTVPSSFVGFSKLTFLELKDVITPDDFFEHFLPMFPVLEELRVADCEEIEPVFVSPSLKTLLFESCIWRIFFKHTPLLSVLSVMDRCGKSYAETIHEGSNPDMVALFASLPALQELNLGTEMLLFLAADSHIPRQLPTTLHHLKVIKIPHLFLDSSSQAQLFICLIRSSPNLQQLTIGVDDYDEDYRDYEVIASLHELLEPENSCGVCCIERLEELNIHDSRGTKVEMELVRFVLANAPLLVRVFIQPAGQLNSTKRLEFLKDVMLCKRMSEKAEVKLT